MPVSASQAPFGVTSSISLASPQAGKLAHYAAPPPQSTNTSLVCALVGRLRRHFSGSRPGASQAPYYDNLTACCRLSLQGFDSLFQLGNISLQKTQVGDNCGTLGLFQGAGGRTLRCAPTHNPTLYRRAVTCRSASSPWHTASRAGRMSVPPTGAGAATAK